MNHIYNLTHKETSILRIEEQTIKHRVYHISYGSCKNKHRTSDNTHRRSITALQEVADALYQTTNHHYTEDAQNKLSPIYSAISRT